MRLALFFLIVFLLTIHNNNQERMQPVNDKIALNLRLNRHLYTDTFFVKGIPNSIIMSETALKEWERDYELQFSIQFKF